jgi:hypothetical protein
MADRLGDHIYGVWIAEVVNDCVVENDERLAVDMNLLVAKLCGPNEFKAAQVYIQFLASDLEAYLNGRPVTEASGGQENNRLLLGCLAMAYCVAQQTLDHYPVELQAIVDRYPVIEECVQFVSADNTRSREG